MEMALREANVPAQVWPPLLLLPLITTPSNCAHRSAIMLQVSSQKKTKTGLHLSGAILHAAQKADCSLCPLEV